MQALRFDVEGASRTYWDFYVGFGHIITGLMLGLAALAWSLGGLARTDARRTRPTVAALALTFTANAVLSHLFFFAIPTVFAVAIVASLIAAIVVAAGGAETATASELAQGSSRRTSERRAI